MSEIYKADLFEWSQRLDTQQSQGVTVVKVERILTSGQNAADVRGRTAAAFINNNQGLNDTEQPEAAGLILQIDDRKVALTNEQGITLAGLGPDISAADYDVFMSGYRMDVNDHQAVTIALQNTLENNAENASRNTQLFVSGLTLKLAEQGNVQVNEASALLASAAGVNGVSAEDVLRGAEQAAISAGDQTAGARIVLAATRATADRLTESAQISVALETQTGLSIQEGSYISEENRNMAPQILSVGLGVELNFEGRRMVEAELQHFAGLSFDARIDESDNTREMIELIGSETRTVVSTASTQEEFRSELETKILNGSVNQDQALGSFIASALSNANAELTVTNIVEITIEAVLLQDADTHKNLIKALFEGVVVAGLQQESVGQMTVAALNTLIEKANVQAENLQDNDLIQAALEGAMKAAVNFNLITTAEGFEQAVDQIAQAVQQVIANVLKVDVVDDKVMEAVAEMVKVVVQAAVNTVLDIEANTTLSEAQQLAAVKAVVTGVTKGITAAAIDAFANPATQMTEAQMISIVETAVDQMFDQMFGQDSKLSAAAQAKYRESIVTGITRGVSEAVFEAVNNGKLTEDQAGRVIEAAVNRVVDNIFDAKFGFTAQAKGQMVGFAINGIAEAALAKSADRTQAMNRISQFTRTAVTAIFGKLTSGATPEEITQIFQGFAEGLSAILNNTHIQVADRLDVLKTTIGTAADQILKTAATPDQRKAAIGGLTAGLADIMNNTTLQSSERVEALQTAFNAVLTAIENIGSEQLSDKEKQELLQQAFDSLSAALAEKISDISRSDDADVTAEKKAENQQEALIVLAAAAEQVLEAADSLSERASKEVARTTIASFTDSLSRIITAITGETVADGADLATVLRNLDGSLLDTSVATLTVKANVITSALKLLGTAGIEVDAEIQQLTAKTVTGLQTQAQLAFIESKNEKNQADTREQALEQTTDAVVSIARIEAARQSGVSEVASNRAAASSIIESAARIAGTDTAAAADIITAAAEALGESNEGAVQALLTMVEQAKKDQDSKKADESKEKDPVLAQLEAIMEAESGRKAASLEANIRSISQNAKFANAEGARIVGDTVVDKDGLTQAQNELLETLGDSINENNSPIQNIINVSRILNSESDQIQELTEADIDAFIDTVFPGLPFGARNQTLALISVAAEVAAALAGGSENLEGLKIEDLLAAAKEMRSENTISPIITLLRQKLGLEIDSAQFSAGFNKLKSDISAKVAQKQRIGKEDLIGLNQLFNNATGGSDAETASGQDLQLDTVNTSDAADTVTTTDAARARTTVRVSTAGEIPLVISNQAAEKGSLRSELLSSISSRTRGDEISQGAVEYMLSQRGLGSSFQTNRYDIYLGLLMDEQQVDALDSTTPGTRPVLKTASSGARYSDEEMVRVLRQADMYQDEQPALKQIRLGSNDKSPVYSIYLFDGPESDFSSARLGSYDRQDGFGSGYRVYVGEKDITRKMSESGISRDAAILSLAAHEAAEANLVLQSAAAHLDAEYKSAGINRAKLDLTKDEDQVIVRNALKDPKNVEWTTPLYTRTHEFGLSVEKAVGTAARLLGDSFRSDDISIQVSADNPTNAVITFDKQSVSAGITEQAGIEIQSIEVKAESGIEELSRATAELEKMDLKVTLNGRLNSRDVVDSYQTQFEIALAPTEELAVVDGILSTEDRVIGITTAGIRTQNVTIEEVGSTESTIALSRSLVQQGSAPAVIRTRIDSDTVIETITDGRFITNTIESGSVRVTLERNLITGSAASAVSRVAALVATIQTAKTAVLSQFNIDIDNTSIANGTGEAQQNARLAVIQFSDRVLSAAKQQNLSVESVSVQTVESSDSKTGFVITTVSDNDQPKTQIVAVRTAAGDVVNLNNALDLQAGISSAEENASDLQADIQRVTVFNRAVQSIVAAAAEITVSVRTLGDAIALIDAFAEFGIGVQIQTAEGTVIASSITETGERVISIISQVLSDGTVIPVNIQLPADEENRELVEQIIKSLVAVAGKSVRSDFITQDETLETNLRKAILENLINNGLNNIANQISVKGIDAVEADAQNFGQLISAAQEVIIPLEKVDTKAVIVDTELNDRNQILERLRTIAERIERYAGVENGQLFRVTESKVEKVELQKAIRGLNIENTGNITVITESEKVTIAFNEGVKVVNVGTADVEKIVAKVLPMVYASSGVSSRTDSGASTKTGAGFTSASTEDTADRLLAELEEADIQF